MVHRESISTGTNHSSRNRDRFHGDMAVRAPAEDRAAVITTPTQAPMWTNHWLKAAAADALAGHRAWEKGATPSRQSTATRVVPWICPGAGEDHPALQVGEGDLVHRQPAPQPQPVGGEIKVPGGHHRGDPVGDHGLQGGQDGGVEGVPQHEHPHQLPVHGAEHRVLGLNPGGRAMPWQAA